MNSIKDQKNLNKKKVLLRLDLNVPLKNGSITDETRINKIIPIIDFLIKVKGYSFKDALYELANKAGVELNYKSSKLNNIIYEINSFTKDIFHQNLLVCQNF